MTTLDPAQTYSLEAIFGSLECPVRADHDYFVEAPPSELQVDAARVIVNDAAMRIEASARQALAATVDGDTLRTMLAALRRLIKVTPINTVAIRRRLADEAVAKGGYIFV